MCRIKKESIILNNNDLKQAKDFAEARENHDISKYKQRGAFKRSDLIAGALGEIAAYKLLSFYKEVSEPDFELYEANKKSFAADLKAKPGELFHIKSQTLESVNKYGKSWVMQRTDPVINNPSKLDYFVPCVVDLKTLKVDIYGVINMQDIISNNLIGEMSVDWLRRTKVAIYLKDLKSLNSRKRWNFIVDK